MQYGKRGWREGRRRREGRTESEKERSETRDTDRLLLIAARGGKEGTTDGRENEETAAAATVFRISSSGDGRTDGFSSGTQMLFEAFISVISRSNIYFPHSLLPVKSIPYLPSQAPECGGRDLSDCLPPL